MTPRRPDGYIHGIAITRSVGGIRVGERLLEWAVERIVARGRQFARLDTIASNGALYRYNGQRGFRSLVTATLFDAMYTLRLLVDVPDPHSRSRLAAQDYHLLPQDNVFGLESRS